MEIDIFNTNSKNFIKNAIDIYNKRHSAIAKNIANVNNPTFKRIKTDFSSELSIAQQNGSVKFTHEKHITTPHFQATIFPKDNRNEKVEITREMAGLAENQIRNSFATKRLARYFKKLELSIKGRP